MLEKHSGAKIVSLINKKNGINTHRHKIEQKKNNKKGDFDHYLGNASYFPFNLKK